MLKLKELRLQHGFTQSKLAEKVGVARSTIAMYEAENSEPDLQTLSKIAEIFNVSIDYLMNRDDSTHISNIVNLQTIKKVNIPILGNIACGEPIFANEQLECYADAINNINADFALWAKGDSMIECRINDGDLVFIKKQDIVDNGEIAAVLIDNEATLKRVFYDKQTETLTLMSANSKYAPFIYNKKDNKDIKILGKAVAFQSIVR